MTWRQWHVARQLLTEETVGVDRRTAQAQEDAEFKRAQEGLRRVK